MSLAHDLYEHDFYAWALEQADLLRRREAGANALDYDNLVEEVEGLAKSDLRSCESLVRRIVDHMMKISAAEPGETALGHWRKEIGEFRLQIGVMLTPMLRLHLEERAPQVIDSQLRLWKEMDRELSAAWRAAPPSLELCLQEDGFPAPGARAPQVAEPA